MQSSKLKWKSDFDKQVLLQNFERRGWQKAADDSSKYTERFEFLRWLEYLLG